MARLSDSSSQIPAVKTDLSRILHLPRARVFVWIALTAIIALAAYLRFANLSALGYANHYYAAAVTSMLKSWHNFFFVAAEPGASVTVDKPPLGLWIQTASAYFLGVNGFALLLPEILAGIISVILVYHLVQRTFGDAAGLLSALALAITPVIVATDRNNTIDSLLILTLLLAAWAFIKAAETSKLRFLFLGALLVGLGFNIKMLQAYLPLPAFYALYFLGSSRRLWRKTIDLVLASVLLLFVSLSWAVAVDLVPPDQRPYIGSSGDNSETSLIIGYNGVERLLGMFGRGRPGSGRAFGGARIPNPIPGPNGLIPGDGVTGFYGRLPNNRFQAYRAFRNDGGAPPGAFPPGGPANNRAPNFAGSGRPGFGGPGGTGQVGALRLFIPPLSKETSWLLPFGLLGAILLLFSSPIRWPLGVKHQSLVLWGGWLVTAGVFFSIAGFFHEYYLSMLAPPLAALVGIGMILIWQWHQKKPFHAVAILLVAAGGTLAFQVFTARAFIDAIDWLPLAVLLFVAGVAFLSMSLIGAKIRFAVQIGFALLTASILLTPGIWSCLTTLKSSENQSLPAAYNGRSSGPANRGGLQINQELLEFLQSHTQSMKYLMAVPSSMQGADYVLATGRAVLYLGGFMGQDQVATAEDLAQLVGQGDLRYIYWEGNGRGGGVNSDITTWLSSACTPVSGFETSTRNSGAPDGTMLGGNGPSSLPGARNFQGGGNMQISLFDCAASGD